MIGRLFDGVPRLRAAVASRLVALRRRGPRAAAPSTAGRARLAEAVVREEVPVPLHPAVQDAVAVLLVHDADGDEVREQAGGLRHLRQPGQVAVVPSRDVPVRRVQADPPV